MLLTIFNHNGQLATIYMVVIMLVSIIGVLKQFNEDSDEGFGIGWIAVLTFLMALIPIQSGDFVYTTQSFQTSHGLHHFEDFFLWLYKQTHDILLWRTVVFGGATLFLYGAVKLLKVNSKFAAFIFVITQMFMFGALRNMLGLMVMFFAVILIFQGNNISKRLCAIVIAGLLLFACTFLHRSMPLYVLLLVVACLPFNGRFIKISLFTFPILYGSIFYLSDWFLSVFLPDMVEHASYYTYAVRDTTFMKTLNELIKHAAYLYLLYLIFREYNRQQENFPAVIRFLVRYAYVLIYVGFLFYEQKTGGWLFERLTWTGDISLMFVIMWFFYDYPRTIGVKLSFGALLYCLVYQIFYVSVYAASGYIDRFNHIQL